MSECERGDHADQAPRAADVEEQADDEQDVVEAEDQVLDAEPEVGQGVAGGLPVDGDRGRLGPQQLGQAVAVLEADAEQDIGQRALQPGDPEDVAVERAVRIDAFRRAVDGPALEQRAGQVLGRLPRGLRAVFGEDRVEQQQERAASRLFPDDLEGPGLDLVQFEVAGTDLVAEYRGREEPGQERRQGQRVAATANQGWSPSAAESPPSSSEMKSSASISTR